LNGVKIHNFLNIFVEAGLKNTYFPKNGKNILFIIFVQNSVQNAKKSYFQGFF